MVFKKPPLILQKVLKFKAFKHKDGKFFLFDVPGILVPLYNKIYEQRLLETKFGVKKAASILYASGYLQGKQGFRMTAERFGYAKTLPNKKELLDFTTGQGDLIGLGSFKWVRVDFKNNIFVMRGKSALAMEFKKFFGLQKKPLDHCVRCESAAFIEEITKQKMLSVETSCISMGKPYCEFVVKPIKNWDKKDIKDQTIDVMPTLDQLGAKIKPYLMEL